MDHPVIAVQRELVAMVEKDPFLLLLVAPEEIVDGPRVVVGPAE